MRIPRIYTSQALSNGQQLELEERAAHYLLQVLRMKVGRSVRLFNGDGNDYLATISDANRRQLWCSVTDVDSSQDRESPLRIELGIGLSKGDRMDWVVQKATELGVARIVPLRSERVDVKLNAEREEKKWRHWQQVMISACEQSGRSQLVDVATPQELEHWIDSCRADYKAVLSPHHGEGVAPPPAPNSVALLVGPEGGLTDDEVARSIELGFNCMALGPRILRTETAPLAAISVLQARWGDFT